MGFNNINMHAKYCVDKINKIKSLLGSMSRVNFLKLNLNIEHFHILLLAGDLAGCSILSVRDIEN